MATGEWIALGSVGASIITTVIAWSLRRNVGGVDDKITQIATDVRQLTSTVGGHDKQLAAGTVEITGLKERVDGIEDRERARGCFGACPAHRATG